MRLTTTAWIVVFAALAGAARAADGQLTPVACPIEQVPDLRGLFAGEQDFCKPTEPKGTVNPHVVVAILQNGAMTVAVAVDSEKPDAKRPDLVRIDFSGKREFAAAAVLPLKPQGNGDQNYWATFGPATVTIHRDGKQIPATIQGSYNKSTNYRYIQLQIGTAIEGRLAFGAQTHPIRVNDSDGDLAFGTKATAQRMSERVGNVQPCDTVSIDTGDGSFRQKVIRAYYGQPVRVDGNWYQLELSPDGTQVSAKPMTCEMAQLHIGHDQWSAILVGDKHILKLEGSAEPIAVPPDRYTVVAFEQSAPCDPRGTAAAPTARLTCRPANRPRSQGPAIDAVAGKPVDLAIGAPLAANIATDIRPAPAQVVIPAAIPEGSAAGAPTAGDRGAQVRMDFSLADAAGMQAQVFLPNAGTASPRVQVFDAAGKSVYEGQFQFG